MDSAAKRHHSNAAATSSGRAPFTGHLIGTKNKKPSSSPHPDLVATESSSLHRIFLARLTHYRVRQSHIFVAHPNHGTHEPPPLESLARARSRLCSATAAASLPAPHTATSTSLPYGPISHSSPIRPDLVSARLFGGGRTLHGSRFGLFGQRGGSSTRQDCHLPSRESRRRGRQQGGRQAATAACLGAPRSRAVRGESLCGVGWLEQRTLWDNGSGLSSTMKGLVRSHMFLVTFFSTEIDCDWLLE